jgi:hypothetical protein
MCRLQSSKLVDSVVTRHIAQAMSRHGSLTLACRTVMELTREIAKSSAAGLRRTWPRRPVPFTKVWWHHLQLP